MKYKEDRNDGNLLWKSSYADKYTRTQVVDENNADTMRIAKVVYPRMRIARIIRAY
jgi:hypothetical protein